jgi:hypothetical protein
MKRSRPSFLLILIVLALLLSAASPKPSPRESAQATSKSSGKAEQTRQAKENPSYQWSAATNPAATPYGQAIGSQIADQNKHKSVAVRVAPIDVNRDWIDYLNPILTILLVVVGAAYTIVAWRQLCAISRQADIAERALTTLERPWIFVALQNTTIFYGPNEYVVNLPVIYRNVGRAPAWLVGSTTTALKLEIGNSLPEEPDYTGYAFYDAPLPIVHSEQVGPYEARLFLKKEEWRAFASGRLELIVWGMVQYRDALTTHVTRFCMRVASPSDEPQQGRPVQCDYGFMGPQAYNRFT